jgi:hypothetical protein
LSNTSQAEVPTEIDVEASRSNKLSQMPNATSKVNNDYAICIIASHPPQFIKLNFNNKYNDISEMTINQ